MKRREFLTKSGLVAAGAAAAVAGLAGCGEKKETAMAPAKQEAPAVITKKTYEMKMVTTWPANFPVFQVGLDTFAQRVEIASEGQIKIKVYSAGELVPAMETFQSVSDGTVEMGSGAAYYWAGKQPAAQWFAAVPFGLNAQGMNAWFYSGGGIQLWEEAYAPFNIIPRPSATPASRWADGLIKKSIAWKTSRVSRCASPDWAARSWPRPAAL
jgi:TRAP-type mannitol/chloroaromatic compound transport system substrate-binding protein